MAPTGTQLLVNMIKHQDNMIDNFHKYERTFVFPSTNFYTVDTKYPLVAALYYFVAILKSLIFIPLGIAMDILNIKKPKHSVSLLAVPVIAVVAVLFHTVFVLGYLCAFVLVLLLKLGASVGNSFVLQYGKFLGMFDLVIQE